jgi:hypothetical protein
MFQVKSERIRTGRSLKTTIHSESHGVNDSCTFYEIDNLDSKTLQQAEDNYEKTFITVRNFLEEQKDEQHNLGSEAARLSLTQGIADALRQTGLIRREDK